jgi:hypothetical protein
MEQGALNSVCNLRSGYPFRSRIKHSGDEGVPVFQPKDIGEDGAIDLPRVVRAEIDGSKTDQYLREGDTLLATRGRIAAATVPADLAEPYVASGSLLVLGPLADGPLVPGYLTVFFNSDYGAACLKRITAQTTSSFVSLSALEALMVPIPSSERQERLVAMAQTVATYKRLSLRRAEILNSLINQQIYL